MTEGAAKGFYLWPTQRHDVMRLECSFSGANHTFNTLWAAALTLRKEHKASYFAMIHADINPEQHWLDTLIDEMKCHQADVISAVVPIKSEEGVTSTALDNGNLWHNRRLTMAEVMDLPETFSSQDVGYPLLVNNGLWVCDFTQPWIESFVFETLNRIGKTPDKHFIAQAIYEDWIASRRWNDLGLKVYATRKVKLSHGGDERCNNYTSWGTWTHDQAFSPAMAELKHEVPVCV